MLSSAPCGSPATRASDSCSGTDARVGSPVPPHQLYLPFPAILSCPCISTKTFRKHGTFSDAKLTSWATRWEVLQGWERDSELPLEVEEACHKQCWDKSTQLKPLSSTCSSSEG